MIAPAGLILVLAAAAACTGSGGTASPDKPQGILAGSVAIGPLCPVEPCSEPDDVYSSRELLLRQRDREAIRIPLAPDGSFTTALPAGPYTVELTDCDFLGCRDALPISISIESGRTTTLQIEIDTGIRTPALGGPGAS